MTLASFFTAQHADDLGATLTKSTSTPSTTFTAQTVGAALSGKSTIERCIFHRFELTSLPRRVTINGVRLALIPTGADISNFQPHQYGFLKQDGLWETSDAFNNTSYPQNLDLPFADWDEGTETDLSVWTDGASGGSATVVAAAAGVLWDVGDGTGIATPAMTATGLAAHLQHSVDSINESAPVVALLTFRTYAGESVGGPTVAMFNHSTYAGPSLEVDFTPGDPESVFTVVPQAQSDGGTMEVTINGTFLDAFDRDVSATVTWTSSIEGLLVTGANFVEQDLTVGAHTMTVVATSDQLADLQTETNYDNSPISEGTRTTGSGYAIGDIITMDDGSTVEVHTLSGSSVATFTVHSDLSGPSIPVDVTIAQASVEPAGGINFSLTPGADNITTLTDTTVFTITVYSVPSDIQAAVTAATVAGVGDGDNTSLQIAGGLLSVGAGGGAGQKGIAVLDAVI